MAFSRHSLPKGDQQLLLILNIICLGILGVSALAALLPAGFPLLHSPIPLCLFRQLTHVPCPTCGLTRGFLAIQHGQWALALRYNILSLPLYFSLWAFLLFTLLLPVQTLEGLKGLRNHRWLLGLLILLFLVAWVLKLGGEQVYW